MGRCDDVTMWRNTCLFLIWLTVFYSFPDMVDSVFPERVDTFLESLTTILRCKQISLIGSFSWILDLREWGLYVAKDERLARDDTNAFIFFKEKTPYY